jgi:hypothetical protein
MSSLKSEENAMAQRLLGLGGASLLALTLGIATPITASAHWVQAPCDFITAGGFVFKDDGARANFGAHGGCKNGKFWGHVNFVDHENNYHISSLEITGYLFDPAYPNARDICGWARTNDEETVRFRMRLADNGEPGRYDMMGFVLDRAGNPQPGERFYKVSTRMLANGDGGGGNVQLHKSNPSTSATPEMYALKEWQMCGDLLTPM